MVQVHAKHSTIKTVQDDVGVIYGKYTPFQFLAYWYVIKVEGNCIFLHFGFGNEIESFLVLMLFHTGLKCGIFTRIGLENQVKCLVLTINLLLLRI